MRKLVERVGKRRDKNDGVEEYGRVKRSQKSETTRFWRDGVEVRCKTASENVQLGCKACFLPSARCQNVLEYTVRGGGGEGGGLVPCGKMQLMLCGEV